MQTKIEKIDSSSALAIKIIEKLNSQPLNFLSFDEQVSFANISHPSKRAEWMTARLAIRDAMEVLDLPYPGFYKDKQGKNQVLKGRGQVSISHTAGVAAAIFHMDTPVGIDIEHIRERVLKIGSKFLSDSELDFIQKEPLLHTIAWSAKESIFKCHGKNSISLRENILLEPFTKDNTSIKGKIIGTEFDNSTFEIKISVTSNIVLAYTKSQKNIL